MKHEREKTAPKIKIMSLPMKAVQKDCREWAGEIAKKETFDLIIFIAKSGYLFAEPMAAYFGCPMAGITAKRPASGAKDNLKGIIRLIPEKLVLKIISSPFMYRFHEKKRERVIEKSAGYYAERKKKHEKVLLVDDSVDTGWTLLQVEEEIKKDFPDAVVRTAGYCVIAYSKSKVSVDYCRYENTVILTATSRKSQEYGKFMEEYERFLKEGRE